MPARSRLLHRSHLDFIDQWLQRVSSSPVAATVRTLDQALTQQPASILAVISVPGDYAAAEAQRALEAGLNVFWFSDHVSLEQGRALKHLARDKGLLVMGPD